MTNPLKKTWHRLKNWRDRDKLKLVPDPFGAWQKMCYVTLVAIVLIFVVHYLLLTHFNSVTPNNSSDHGASGPALNPKVLGQVADEIRARAAVFQSTLNQPPAIVDPAR